MKEVFQEHGRKIGFQPRRVWKTRKTPWSEF